MRPVLDKTRTVYNLGVVTGYPMQQSSLKIYVLGHTGEQLSRIPAAGPALVPVDLRIIPLPAEYAGNQLCENKVYLSPDFENPAEDYIGFVSASWDAKWHGQRSARLEGLPSIAPLEHDLVWIVEAAGRDWVDFADYYQPGIRELMEDMGRVFSLDLTKDSFWRNNFICHREVYLRFLEWWRRIFHHYHGRFGFNIPYNINGYPEDRRAAYFYERVSTAIFSNLEGLRFRQIG